MRDSRRWACALLALTLALAPAGCAAQQDLTPVLEAGTPAPEPAAEAPAAALAATYSQAKNGGKAAVDCTQVRFVKKPSGAKPGRVIYTDYRTIITAADEALAERLRRE